MLWQFDTLPTEGEYNVRASSEHVLWVPYLHICAVPKLLSTSIQSVGTFNFTYVSIYSVHVCTCIQYGVLSFVYVHMCTLEGGEGGTCPNTQLVHVCVLWKEGREGPAPILSLYLHPLTHT